MFEAIIVIMFSIWGIGNSQQYIGDVESAKNVARDLFSIIDSKDEFQMQEGKFLSLLMQ